MCHVEPASGETCKESGGSTWGWKEKGNQILSACLEKAEICASLLSGCTLRLCQAGGEFPHSEKLAFLLNVFPTVRAAHM